jgi:putative hydrolase of the HAD superfamily
MLQQIQDSFPHVIVGAITNGKGNPLAMTRTLAPYFDFCVSGEDETVFPHRKPHATIFQVALDRAHEILLSQQTDRTEKVEEESLASCWIHVGDDLCNDVAASAACGAKALWVDLKPEYGQTSSKRLQGLNPSWSTASSAEIDQRRIASQEAQRSSVTARVERLSDLPGVLSKL